VVAAVGRRLHPPGLCSDTPDLPVVTLAEHADSTVAYNIAAYLDLPPAVWSGSRARLGAVAAMSQRPVNREPGSR
jgi:hypothetical protein